MSRSPTTFNIPAAPLPTSDAANTTRSRPSRRHSAMVPDAYARALADRGAAATAPPVVAVAASGGANPDFHFDFASAAHDQDHPLHSPFTPSATFASAAADVEDAEMRFERELADSDMAQYFAFDALDPSSPFLTNSSPIIAAANTNGAAHASPPPGSDVDGTSPALSDSNSIFGLGPGASPRSPPLYSPVHDFPALGPGPSGLGPGFNDGSGDGGALFASPYGYGYEYALGGADPYAFLSSNPCADATGLGFSPNTESAPMPWDTLDLLSAQPQPQPQSPKAGFETHSPTAPHNQNSMQAQQQQLFLPSEAMDAPPRPHLAPYTSPAISPRDLELPTPASAPVLPSTPSWAAQLWDAPASSSPMMLSDHGRSASEASVFGHHGHGHGQAFEFVPPPSAPAAIPIPSSVNNNNNNGGGNADFHAYSHSTPALSQLFQPASAPAQAPSGFGFMPPPPSPFALNTLDSAFNPESPSRSAGNDTGPGNRNGNGSGLRARMRSYSHRMSSGLRDAQRAVFSTRASAGFAQGQQQGEAYARDKMRMKAEEDKAWSAGLGMEMNFDRDTDVSMNMNSDANMATVRVAFPSSVPLPSSSTSSLGLGLSEADPEATVRRKKRTSSAQTPSPNLRAAVLSSARAHSREPSSEKDVGSPSSSSRERDREPLRSELRPPKLAPSTWQLYFTDWIQRHQMLSGGDRKLNVAQAAKEAGAEYASLSAEQKEPYKRRSQAAKEARERELAAWQRTLTPDDIKRENAFRAAQRRAGKSRKGNIKDPNAPKKPLSAYFMFLQHIRADAERVRQVFGEERETTAQSVLAAQTWRAMSDEERKPFLAQAEKEKLAYEAARRMYEEGTVGFETTISFSNTNASGSSPASASGSGSGLGMSSSFSAYSPTGSGSGTTFVIGRPAHEAGSDSELEAEMDSEGCTTDEEHLGPRRMGGL